MLKKIIFLISFPQTFFFFFFQEFFFVQSYKLIIWWLITKVKTPYCLFNFFFTVKRVQGHHFIYYSLKKHVLKQKKISYFNLLNSWHFDFMGFPLFQYSKFRNKKKSSTKSSTASIFSYKVWALIHTLFFKSCNCYKS